MNPKTRNTREEEQIKEVCGDFLVFCFLMMGNGQLFGGVELERGMMQTFSASLSLLQTTCKIDDVDDLIGREVAPECCPSIL